MCTKWASKWQPPLGMRNANVTRMHVMCRVNMQIRDWHESDCHIWQFCMQLNCRFARTGVVNWFVKSRQLCERKPVFSNASRAYRLHWTCWTLKCFSIDSAVARKIMQQCRQLFREAWWSLVTADRLDWAVLYYFKLYCVTQTGDDEVMLNVLGCRLTY